MVTTGVVVLVLGTVLSLAVLALVLVVVVDRVRGTAERLLAVREVVLPAVAQLQRDAEAAGARAASLRERARDVTAAPPDDRDEDAD